MQQLINIYHKFHLSGSIRIPLLLLLQKILGAFFLITLFGVQNLSAEENEYAVKAAFIGKLLQFIEWPSDSNPKSRSDLYNFCIFDQHPLNQYLKTIDKIHLISLRKLDQNYANIESCDILFITETKDSALENTLKACKRYQPILTFSDSNQYAQKGVMFNFYVEEKRIGFEINWNAAKQAGFQISSRVLKLARIVDE